MSRFALRCDLLHFVQAKNARDKLLIVSKKKEITRVIDTLDCATFPYLGTESPY